MNVDPRIGKNIGAVHNQAHGEEVAIAECARGGLHFLRRRRVEREHQFLQRNRREKVGAFLLKKFALGIRAGNVRHASLIPVDRLHLAIKVDRAALFHDLRCRRLPHLAGAEAGIKESADQRLRRRRGFLTLEGGDDSLAQGKALDPLRGPVGADFVARNAPDFFGVRLEKNLEQALAETVRHPLRERVLRLDRLQPRLQVADENVDRLCRAEIHERIHGLERVVEIFALVVNAREPRAIDEVIRHDLAPDFVHFLRLAEKAVPADIKAEALRLHRTRNAADVGRV